jgi:hypothetical protein
MSDPRIQGGAPNWAGPPPQRGLYGILAAVQTFHVELICLTAGEVGWSRTANAR